MGRPRAGWLAPTTPLGSSPLEPLGVANRGRTCWIVTILCNGGWHLAGPWPGVAGLGSPVSTVECRDWWVRAGTHFNRGDPGPPGPTTCRCPPLATLAHPWPVQAYLWLLQVRRHLDALQRLGFGSGQPWPWTPGLATLARPGPPWGVTTAAALCVSPSHFPNKKGLAPVGQRGPEVKLLIL